MSDRHSEAETKGRRISLAGTLYLALIVIVVLGAVLLPRLVAWVDEIHPRNVTRALAAWEKGYGEVSTFEEAKTRISLMEYVQNHYRYEDRPEYRDNKVVQDLAVQRAKTLATMADTLRRFSGEDHGDDLDAWRAWLANEQQKGD